MSGTLSLIEAIWLPICLIGLVLSAANLMDAWDSYQVAIKAGTGRLVKQVIAMEHVRMESTYLLIHLLFLAIGFVAALTPAVAPTGGVVESRAMLSAAVLVPAFFFTVQIAMIINSALVRRDRKYLMSQRLAVTVPRETAAAFNGPPTPFKGQVSQSEAKAAQQSEATEPEVLDEEARESG